MAERAATEERAGRLIGIIPARGGSKGIARKNVKEIAGKPLIAWTILAAQEATLLDDWFVSTEDEEIATIAKGLGAKVLERPAALATDTADMMDVLAHAVEKTGADVIVLLQPTSPVREPGLVDRCIAKYREAGADTLATGYMSDCFEYGTYSDNRQALVPFFHDDGNVYIFSAGTVRQKRRMGDRPVKVELSREQNFEIDEEFDFWLNEQVLLKREAKKDE